MLRRGDGVKAGPLSNFREGGSVHVCCRKVFILLFCILGFLPAAVSAEGDNDQEKILAGFFPYRDGLPHVELINFCIKN